MKNIISKYFFSALVFSVTAHAQVPTPAPAQQKAVIINGVTIHTGNGQTIDNGSVAFANGKLTYVGPAAGAPATASAEVINATGKHVYPGFIMTNSQIGLEEISSVRATLDSDEAGDLNPNIRSQISYL